jgi:hypothetical protein
MVAGDMKYVASSQKVNLSKWSMGDGEITVTVNGDSLGPLLAVVSTVIQQQLLETPPSLDLPFYWGKNDGRTGSCPTDPLTIYLNLPLGDEDDEINFEISFETLVDDVIDVLTNLDGETDQEELPKLQHLARRLREMADKLEAVPVKETAK